MTCHTDHPADEARSSTRARRAPSPTPAHDAANAPAFALIAVPGDSAPYLVAAGIVLIVFALLRTFSRRYAPQMPESPALARPSQRTAVDEPTPWTPPPELETLVPGPAAPLPHPPAAVDLADRRISDATAEALADELVQRRARARANLRLGEDLAMLDRASWHVERDVTVDGIVVPYLVLGPTGIFALTAAIGWRFADLPFLDHISAQLGTLIPGYPDRVRATVYLPYTESAARSWFDGHGHGGWTVGKGGLVEFLSTFTDHGVAPADLLVIRDRVSRAQSASAPARLPRDVPRG